jgi:hypothetical protein
MIREQLTSEKRLKCRKFGAMHPQSAMHLDVPGFFDQVHRTLCVQRTWRVHHHYGRIEDVRG